MIWEVFNRETGIVVSRWEDQNDALDDKRRRDDEWQDVESGPSPLEVRALRDVDAP